MVSPIVIMKELKALGIDVPLLKIKELLNEIDFSSQIENAKKEYSIEIWDKESPINGVPAEKVKESHQIEDSDVVLLIKKYGQTIILQKNFHPQFGQITESNYKYIGEKIIEDITKGSIDLNLILEQIIMKLQNGN